MKPPQSPNHGADARRISLPVDATVEDYKAGTTLTEIGRKYGVNRLTIRNRLVRSGVIEPRDEWEREAVHAASLRQSQRNAPSWFFARHTSTARAESGNGLWK